MGIRILIVEDEAMSALYLKKMLIKKGIGTVVTVSSGEDALKKAGDLSPELVLMDIRLAGDMNGIETAREIKLFSNPDFIFMSGYSDEDIISEAGLLGAMAYLTKPLNFNELFEIINRKFMVSDCE